MSVRPAVRAGTWYSGSPSKLVHQLDEYFKKASKVVESVPDARILIGPHAGYSYSGERLAETFKSWDTSNVKRVFILGPSHQFYFRGKVLLSPFGYYETPFGNLPVDVETVDTLISLKGNKFQIMSEDQDEAEHSFEMHAPYIYYSTQSLPQGLPKIVPMMICETDEASVNSIIDSLLPYLEDSENTFIISSDFCHWGSRFDYTMYVPQPISGTLGVKKDQLISLSSRHRSSLPRTRPIFESIEDLDKEALRIAATGSYKHWNEYIKLTGNTICGQKPIAIILRMLEKYRKEDNTRIVGTFQWIGYSQSSKVCDYTDSSVSYASGYMTVT